MDAASMEGGVGEVSKAKRNGPFRLVTVDELFKTAEMIPCGAAGQALADMLRRHEAGQQPICFEDDKARMLVVTDVQTATTDGLTFYE